MFALQILLLSRFFNVECDYSFHYFGETNAILIFVKSYKFTCVGVPEWLLSMTRNHVCFARTGLNLAALMINGCSF